MWRLGRCYYFVRVDDKSPKRKLWEKIEIQMQFERSGVNWNATTFLGGFVG